MSVDIMPLSTMSVDIMPLSTMFVDIMTQQNDEGKALAC
jgi:hypothetical protein